MNFVPVNFRNKFTKFTDLWSPKIIAEMNNYQFKLVKVQGKFVWHNHPDTDEAFIVLKGTLDIEFRGNKVTLKPGELFVVPRGHEHRPVAQDTCEIMVIEPKGIVNTGDAKTPLTAANDVWI